MVSFKGAQFPQDVILHAVFFYVRYAVSYRDLEEILAERGVCVDHATLNRWVVKYAPSLARIAQKRKAPTEASWRLDETYVKVRGDWCYLYRAVDRNGQTLDFMLSEHRDEAAALRFLAKAISANGLPRACGIDKSGANTAGLKGMNKALRAAGSPRQIRVYRSKYLNNIVEQDHRGVKRRTRPMMGFKSFTSATATLDGIETAHMIRKGQLGQGCPFAIYASLAA
jgi:putative transposase